MTHVMNAGLDPYPATSRAVEAMLLESITDAFLALDGEWRFRFVNARATELIGRPRHELIGRTVWDLYPEARESELSRALTRVMHERRPVRGEAYSFLARTWVDFRAYPTADGFALLLRDVADERRARQTAELMADAGTLLAASLDLRETLDRLADLVVPRLADVCTIDVMEAGDARPIVTTCTDRERQRILEAIRGRASGASDARDPMWRAIESGESILVSLADAQRPDPHGDRRLLRRLGVTSAVIVPLVARGRVLGSLGLATTPSRTPFDEAELAVVRELGVRAALAIDAALLFAEAQKARDAAEAANQAKAEFLATMSHELRTPLTAIRGFTELVLDGVAGPLTEAQRDHLTRVNGASEHLLVLVEDVLGFARLQAGRAEIRVQPVQLNELADSALNLVRPMMDAKRLELVRATPAGDVRLLTDADKVRQILVNLLSNAVKFTERGHVRFAAEVEGEHVLFVVSDTGPGIAAGELESIFEPFRQVDQSLTRRVGGAGLGLAVVRRLSALLAGSVAVESAPGVGSTFTVRLPRRHVPPVA